jgi:hypothetical protein
MIPPSYHMNIVFICSLEQRVISAKMDTPKSNPHLLDQALEAQQIARSRSVFTTDTILVSKKTNHFNSPCGVHVLTKGALREKVTLDLARKFRDVA